MGLMPIAQAREHARALDLDLVEVAPHAVPPVCKCMDYRRQQFRRAKARRQSSHLGERSRTKEITFRPGTYRNDIRTKLRAATRFLEAGHAVKLTVRFRGRELSHHNLGEALLNDALQQLGELGQADAPMESRGRHLSVTVRPFRKPSTDHADRAQVIKQGRPSARYEA